jgi:hypothetical protein
VTRVARLPAPLLALLLALLVSGCTAGRTAAGPSPAPQPPPVAEPAVCGSPVLTGPLPEWARGGFSFDGAGVPHVLGRRGDIAAILFGRRLTAPPRPDASNKILWVSRIEITAPGQTLVIDARRDGSADVVRREIGSGPGPSIVDLPAPGCWRLTLTWAGHTDTLDLIYEPGPSAAPS